ncbi:MAG: DOPA 4,5-dioxygenase family protein [Proteobacteria bacterium]|nr:DOPA 4,5-dioxygenase family protein [Pseudomonadota bacterium]
METPEISDWHAHVYFDAATRDAAWALRERIEKTHAIQMGRFHEKPVGPHPMFSYQVTVRNEQFAEVMSWLALNHGALTVFVHPNTGHDLEDHRDRAIWIGQSVPLNLDMFTKKKD